MKLTTFYLKTFTLSSLCILAITTNTLKAQNGSVYCAASMGGTHNHGTLVKYNPSADKDTVVWNFGAATDSATEPIGHLTYCPLNGLLYGFTRSRTSNGTIISFNPHTNQENAVWVFGSGTDGVYPMGGLVYDTNRKIFYGMTRYGGTYSGGTILSFDPSTNHESVLWSFGHGTDGANPMSGLTYYSKLDAYYGLTSSGGTNTVGAIIYFDPASNYESLVYNFDYLNNGNNPNGSLVYEPNKKLFYGTCNGGGSLNAGTIFSLNPNGNAVSLAWTFGNGNDAWAPFGSLVYDTASEMLYGTTYSGGANSNGTIFKLNASTNQESVVWSFGGSNDGTTPYGSLVYNSLNKLYYVTTPSGGSIGEGALISFDASTNTEKVVVSFGGALGYVLTDIDPMVYDTIVYTKPTGISEIKRNVASIQIYPNPSNGVFTFSINPDSYREGITNQIELYNVLGEKVFSDVIRNSHFVIDLSTFAKGIYAYRVINANGEAIATGKVITQ